MLDTIVKMLSIAMLPVLVSVVLYMLERRGVTDRLPYAARQIIYGVLFGLLAVLGTEKGVTVEGIGATLNTRDASVLCGGLLFGAPAGIIAGLIGGIERWFAVYWGAGMYTRLACTIATIFAGFFAAVLRKYIFDDKRPTWYYALAVGLVSEVLHMLCVFLTNMDDVHQAFTVISECSVPMISVNGFAVMLAVLIITLIGHDFSIGRGRRRISQKFQRGLLAIVLTAFAVTGIFTFVMQTRLSENDTRDLLKLNINDMKSQIADQSDEELLAVTRRVAELIDMSGERSVQVLKNIATVCDVYEINIIDEDGIIHLTTNPEFIKYDMSSGEQSAEFLCLLEGTEEMVQEYQPLAYDSTMWRKYAGHVLEWGGFVQVARDEFRYHASMSDSIRTLATNRHIGEEGVVIIVDTEKRIVSDPEGFSDHNISVVGLSEDFEKYGEENVFTTKLYDRESFCMYAYSEGYYIFAAQPLEEALFSRDISVYITIFMEILIFGALFIIVYFLIKDIVVDNIHDINRSLAKITGGDLSVVVNVRGNEEFASLSDDINSTVDTLKRYIAEASARIDAELEFAKNIQLSALPSVFPPFPDREEFDIWATMEAAKEVGGDFYDFYLLGQDKLVFLIADVSGKGIPAAMFMMRAKTTIKGLVEAGKSVEQAISIANDNLCTGNDAGMFVTAWLGCIDLKSGFVKYANAGHNKPAVRHRDGTWEYLESSSNFILGGLEGFEYKPDDLKLEPGDELFIYTDGVTESINTAEELYGEERLLDVLNAIDRTEPTETIIKTVRQSITDYVGEAEQFDDITMVALKFIRPMEIKNEKQTKELTILATIPNIETVTNFVNDELDRINCPSKEQAQLDIAVDEIFSNIANYAYAPETGMATIRLTVENSPNRVTIDFIDSGKPYNPLEHEDPDVSLPPEERGIGGLGIFIVKNSMDNVNYEYVNGRNVFSITKNL